jgi:hypothetical protein
MILFFRKKQVSKTIFKGLLIVITASMVIGVGLTTSRKGQRSTAIASIDGQEIKYQDFARREKVKREQIALMRYQLEQMGIPDEGLSNFDSKKVAFSGILEETLLNRVAQSLKIELDEEYVISKLMDNYYMTRALSEFFPSYFALAREFDRDLLEGMLRNNGMGLADFESFVEKDLERKVVKDLTSNALYNPMFIVRRKFTQDYSAKKFSALKMSTASFLKKAKEQDLAEADIVSFFKSHEQDYRVPEKRDAVAWEFSPASYDITVSDADIKDYYEKNKSKFVAASPKIKVRRILFKTPNEESLLASRVKAEAVYNELAQKPELFGQKAIAVSEDSATAKNGGVVDFFSRGEKDTNFEKAAFRLQKDGDISPLIQTESGLEILQRVERKPSTFKPLSLVSADIRDTLAKQLFKKRFELDSEKLLKNGKDVQAVVAFAKKHQAKRTELKKVEYNDSLQGEMLFKLKDGFSSYHDKDKGIILQLSTVHKSSIPALDTIKSKVVADLYRVKAEQSLLTSLDRAKQKAGNESLTKVAQEHGAKVESLGWLKNEKTAELEKLGKDGLPVAQMLQMEKSGSLLAYYDGTQAYLLRLDEIESVKDKELASKLSGITKDLARTNATVALDGFVASLIRNATLKTYEESLNLNDFDTTS